MNRVALLAAMVVSLAAGRVEAALIFIGSHGSLSAEAMFSKNGDLLTVVLKNTSTADAGVPTDVLTAMFFNIAGDPELLKQSAVTGPGATVYFSNTPAGSSTPFSPALPAGSDVGGEWAYLSGLNQYGDNQGLSSAGFTSPTSFGPTSRFNTATLFGEVAPDGLDFGVLPVGDNPATGNGDLHNNPLINNSVVFVLGGFADFSEAAISDVVFQYGTSLADTSLRATPEPTSLVIWGVLGAGAAAGLAIRRHGRMHSRTPWSEDSRKAILEVVGEARR